MLQRFVTGLALCFLLALAGPAAADNYPQEIAAEVALYPGAQVFQQSSDDEGVQVVLNVAAAPEKVMAYYRKHLEKGGWKQVNIQNMGTAQAIEFAKGERHMLVTVMLVQNQTTATIGLSRE